MSSRPVLAVPLGARAGRLHAPRKRSLAARRASSGSSDSLRATLTAANRTSPSSWKPPGSRSRPTHAGVGRRAPSSALELAQLFAQRADRAVDVGVVEAALARRGAAACARAAARAGSRGPRRTGTVSRPASPRLIASQLLSTSCGVPRRRLAEHVRMAADQLLGAVIGHGGQIAGAALLEQHGEEVHLKQHVAELVHELGVVAGVRGVGELIRLLDACAARSSARPARDPTGIRAAAGG